MESYSSDSSYNAFASESSISDINSPQNYQRAAGNGGPRSTNVKCRYFMNNGYCFYGDKCQFLHVYASPNGTPSRNSKNDSFVSSEGI